MNRREFFLKTGLISAALAAAATPEVEAPDTGLPSRRVARNGVLALTNDALTWHLEWRDRKCYPNQTMWSLDDWRKVIDQMAKMRMNYLQIFWFPNTPWLSYEYRGEKNFLGDASVKESGYLLWQHQQGSFLVKDVTIGRDRFKYPRIAPHELQDVETPDQAFQKAQDLLRVVSAYAKARKIKTWLAIDPVSMPPNLARFARNRTGDLPFQPVLGGAYLCPADPVAHEINESRLKSLFATYPEAEGYFLWFPELYPVCDDDKSRAYTLQERPKFFAEETLHWQTYANGYERNADRGAGLCEKQD